MVSNSLKSRISALFPQKAKRDFLDFTSLYLDRLDDEDIIKSEPQHIADILVQLWAFMKQRDAGKSNILISSPLNPVLDWTNTKTSFFIATKERAFLIDSIVAELISQNLRIATLMHPVLSVERDEAGHLKKIKPPRSGKMNQESILYIEVEGSLTKEECKKITKSLHSVLADVRMATNDWQAMKERLMEVKTELLDTLPVHIKNQSDKNIGFTMEEPSEYAAFLQYLHDDNFTLVGFRAYEFKGKGKNLTSTIIKGSSLGLLHDEVRPAYLSDDKEPLTPDLQDLRRMQAPITLSKVSRRSTVHRRVPLAGIHIKSYDKKGNIIGEKLFIGLFTSVTYSRSMNDVPLLRTKVQRVIKQSDFPENSHKFKALNHILEKYPRDELFQISADQLFDFTHSILRLQDRPRIALYTRFDPFRRYISALVYIPRELYGTKLRRTFQSILSEELGGVCNTFYTTLDDSPLARVLFIIKTDQNSCRVFDVNALEKKLAEVGRDWEDRLLDALIGEYGDRRMCYELARSYGDAFPPLYQDKFMPVQAVRDIEKLEDLKGDKELREALYRPVGLHKDKMRLKIYAADKPVPLSNIIPVVENMGLRVISELPFEVKPEHHSWSFWIHDFLIETKNGTAVNVKDVQETFENALHNIWYKRAENDALNRLILNANMPWRDIVILRAYTKYLRQARFPFTPDYMMSALTDFPAIAKLCVDWFKARHNLAQDSKKRKSDQHFTKAIEKELEKVASLDQDRILRAIRDLIRHTLRTNFFQLDDKGAYKDYVSFKIDSQKLDFLPAPKPFAEIFVHSPYMEGVHLRGGKIARGGIRWSDRHEDFRTEILGLMKAQVVKNAVIVPIGAKGGFIVKRPPLGGDRKALQEEGIRCYQTLVKGMLDITDNLEQEKVIPPKDVVRHDGDDPYLVVAADKGTATFSDIANALSQEYGFWLGDAFASGGSAGYDHKVMGITARGAWESVKRHFRELDHDTQSTPFDVIGVGDMGGDVFGNGMLLSEHIRLVGAFNHLHIFCDPAPEANMDKNYAERKRLFDAVKGWDEYDTKLLSKGGMIYDRTQKSLKLTPEIKARFAIKDDEITPNELIRSMLKLNVDLLWFGGIGTYIKSSHESDADVGDKTNDPLRVNVKEIHARVIGEGANLGVTQLGRIELSQNNVKVNADFIDNSGGVDCSDHEVNIKIMFAQHMQQSKGKSINLEQRNKILEEMTDEVASHVLENNYQQSQAISLAEVSAADDLYLHARLIQELEQHENLNRKLEALPNEEEIQQRAKAGQGLTRPELGVLISHAKIRLFNDLMKSDVPSDKSFEPWLIQYFPHQLHSDFKDSILSHKLKAEIIATRLAGSIVNRYGPTFIMNMVRKLGISPATAAKAALMVREVFQLKNFWTEIEALDNKAPAKGQLAAQHMMIELTEHVALWFLNNGILDNKESVQSLIELYRDGAQAYRSSFDNVLPKSALGRMRVNSISLTSKGLPRNMAEQVAALDMMRPSCDLTNLSQKSNMSIEHVAHIYHHLGEALNIGWLHDQTRSITTTTKWQQNVLETLKADIYTVHADICHNILKSGKKGASTEQKIAAWTASHDELLSNVQKSLHEIKVAGVITDLATLTYAEQSLRRLL
jgi:glutamate dehydrogenase